MGIDLSTMRADARAILRAGVEAAESGSLVRRAVTRDAHRVWFHPKEAYDLRAFQRIIVVGAGKAAGPMAQAIEGILGERLSGGVIAVPRATRAVDLPRRIESVEAEHPVPGEGSLRAAQAVRAMASQAGERDLVVALVSGGASSLLAAPEEGLELEDLRATWRALLASGLDIHAMNAVRKHLTRLGGGKLARIASPAPVVSLILSDVPGNRLDSVGSGPTVADRSTFEEAVKVMEKAGASGELPARVRSFLADGAQGKRPETVKPGDALLQKTFNRLIGSNEDAVAGALVKAAALGYTDAGDFRSGGAPAPTGGDARAVGRALGAFAVYLQEVMERGYRPARRMAIIAGGEAPVRVQPGGGRGGRLSELVLSAAEVIDGRPGILVAAAATDGQDGAWDAAGAIADGDTLRGARAAGVDPEKVRQASDTAAVFEAAGGAIPKEATRTNVTDLYLAVVWP